MKLFLITLIKNRIFFLVFLIDLRKAAEKVLNFRDFLDNFQVFSRVTSPIS